MNHAQKTVALGAAAGVCGMLGLVGLFSMLIPTPAGVETMAERLAFALQWNVIAAIPLFVMFITVANSRFASDAIDPLARKETIAQETNGRVLDNTLQQNFIFFIVTLALSTVLEATALHAIAAASIVFVLARIAFWIGYRVDPLLRAPGMAATGYLNLGIMALVLYQSFA